MALKKPKTRTQPETPPINREAFDLFAKLLTDSSKDPQRSKIGNESLIADLLGEDPVPIPPSSTVDPKVAHMVHAFIDLLQVTTNFSDIETMIRYYPWRGKISQGKHLENCYYLAAHETYILEERLKRFLNSVAACAEGLSFAVDFKKVRRNAMKRHGKIFGQLVAARGQHVHQQSNIPRDIKRVASLELLIAASAPGPWKFLQRQAVKSAREHWIENCAGAYEATQYLIATVLSETKAVWETVLKDAIANAATG